MEWAHKWVARMGPRAMIATWMISPGVLPALRILPPSNCALPHRAALSTAGRLRRPRAHANGPSPCSSSAE
eukprot:1808703-Heterocapsa_arctica.AAC.1